ncbi:MAG TPA: hypothetical protein VHB01_10460 [Nitrosospira sp.]|jgi:hypothetical protein|nr:hypothetical protein [Nitrosospira sp.]
MKPNEDRAISEAGKILEPPLEQLQQSHQLLEALVAALPPHTRKELAGLLQTLAAGDTSKESLDSVHQKALQIVSNICKPAGSREDGNEESRIEGTERRQGDRRRK